MCYFLSTAAISGTTLGRGERRFVSVEVVEVERERHAAKEIKVHTLVQEAKSTEDSKVAKAILQDVSRSMVSESTDSTQEGS